jgi:dihydrofolate synthase/folylpolyglutamate synthase
VDFDGALAYLAEHISLEADTSARAAGRRLDRIRRLLAYMGDPQHAYPVIHVTGTNGKGSTVRMVTSLLVGQGLAVGTYTSPHLERITERIAWSGEPIDDDAFAGAVRGVADLEPLLESRLTHFEILTAAAFRWFADVAVDAAVVEVGLGGRRDATNVADGSVAVVTNVSADHTETIGPTLVDIAREKAGIVKPGRTATLVLGETAPPLAAAFRAEGPDEVWERGRDFGCASNRLAISGRAVEVFTPGTRYPDLFVPAHGAYQGDNAAAAVAAAEAFFGAPLDRDVVAERLAAVTLPGRLEVVGRHPLVILDGAHNPAGAAASSAALAEAFGNASGRVLVVGLLQGRDPAEMLAALRVTDARLVVACPPPSPRAQPPQALVEAAQALGRPAVAAPSVEAAVDLALAEAGPEEMVLVTGSLYVVGTARAHLR